MGCAIIREKKKTLEKKEPLACNILKSSFGESTTLKSTKQIESYFVGISSYELLIILDFLQISELEEIKAIK